MRGLFCPPIGLGSEADTVFAGAGSSTVVSGTGRDVFAIVNGRAGPGRAQA